MTAIFKRSWQMAKKLYYTQGFWTWKNLSSIPDRSASIDGGIGGKSNALWNKAEKPLEQRLMHPDGALVAAICAEKADAVKLAETNLSELTSLRPHIAKADYAELEKRLRLAVDLAKIYQGIAEAYWRIKLAEHSPNDSAASTEKVNASLSALTKLVALLDRNVDAYPWIGKQSPRLLNLHKDLAARFARIDK
jgi:hypothetical protein